MAYLWQSYLEARTDGALTFTELAHWAQLTGQSLEPWEVDMLRSLDRIYWKVMNE